MAYKSEKEHELKLKVNVSKGSKVQNREVKVPVKYRFPTDEDGLVTNNGQYDIVVTNDDGTETVIGNGGNAANNGIVQITDKDKLLETAQKSNRDVTASNLDAAMANGGTDDLKKTGLQKRNDNLSAKSQQDLANKNNLSAEQKENQGLTKTKDTDTKEEDKESPETEDADGNDDTTDGNKDSEQSSSKKLGFKTGQSTNFGTMWYPEGMEKLKQDYVKFRTYRYEPQAFKGASEGFGFGGDFLGQEEGSCYLPIQSAADGNTVSWGNNEVSPIQAAAYQEAYNLILGNKQAGDQLNKGMEVLANSNEMAKKFIAMKMAQGASQTTNMLSRTSGAIINPNMVLLFQKPELRNFSYNYTFRPRNSAEAQTVRRIIRMFKQSMSVRQENTNLFLLAPNVFQISYHRGGVSSEDHSHQSIGRPKVVALKSCAINYAPDGSYMTFNDPAGTMTAYSMQLSFTEMEPLYYDDYDPLPTDEIGF